MQFQLSNGQDCGFVFTHRGGVGGGKGTYAEVSPSGGSTLVMCKKTETHEIFSQLLVFTVTPSSKSFNKKRQE